MLLYSESSELNSRPETGTSRARLVRDARTYQAKKEALLKKAMTTKYPLVLILMEMAQELALKNCELQLQWMRGDFSQLADDLTNEELAKFDHTPQGGRLRTEDIGPATRAFR